MLEIDGYLKPSTSSARILGPLSVVHMSSTAGPAGGRKCKRLQRKGIRGSHVVNVASDNVSTTVRHAAVVDVEDTAYRASDNGLAAHVRGMTGSFSAFGRETFDFFTARPAESRAGLSSQGVGMRVLLSEASSLTAREHVSVLGREGISVDAASSKAWPIARFSPITQGEVEAALQTKTGPPESAHTEADLCTFSPNYSDIGSLRTSVSKFPFEGQIVHTLAEAYAKLSDVARGSGDVLTKEPRWGQGAFLDAQDAPGIHSYVMWIPKYMVALIIPTSDNSRYGRALEIVNKLVFDVQH